MKKQLFALLGLGLLLATASAYAQTINLKADVPFNFVLNGRTLPSGEYAIRSLDGVNHALLIRGEGEKPNIFMANSCMTRKSLETKLVFTRYGDQYFLSQIWTAGNDAGYQLPKSGREVEVAQDYRAGSAVVQAELR